MSRARLFLPLAVAVLCGCPQSIDGVDRDRSPDDVVDSDAGDPEADAGGHEADAGAAPGRDAGAGTADGGVRSDGGTGAPVTVSCARAGGATGAVTANMPVEIACTSSAPAGELQWSVRSEPDLAFFSNELVTAGRLWVTFRGADLPKDFADTDARVVITATAPDGGSGEAAVTVPVLGNVLVADGSGGGIAAFRSDGTTRSEFVGPMRIAKPTFLVRLKDGNILAGQIAGAGLDPLQVFDAHGAFVRKFASADHAGNTLFETDARPWGAAQDANGDIWVSKWIGDFANGALYRFSAQGTYLETVAPPSDLATLQSKWVPMGVAVLSDGTVVAANGAGGFTRPHVAVFPRGGVSRHIRLSFLVCDTAAGGEPSCRDNGQSGGRAIGLVAAGGELFVSLDYSSGATVAAYSDPDLGFLRSTQHKSGSEYGFYNYTFTWIGRVGNLLVVSKPYGCPVAVDRRSLYVPAGWRDPQSGCWTTGSSTSMLRGVLPLEAR